MGLLSNEDILKNNVDTIPQFYILDYLLVFTAMQRNK